MEPTDLISHKTTYLATRILYQGLANSGLYLCGLRPVSVLPWLCQFLWSQKFCNKDYLSTYQGYNNVLNMTMRFSNYFVTFFVYEMYKYVLLFA